MKHINFRVNIEHRDQRVTQRLEGNIKHRDYEVNNKHRDYRVNILHRD